MDFMLSSCMALTVSAAMTFTIGFMTSLSSLLAVFVCNGFALGFFDTGAYIFILELWGRNAVPFMQVLISMIGIGSLLAPVLAEPFLTKEAIDTVTGIHVKQLGRSTKLIFPYSVIGLLLAFNAAFSLLLYKSYAAEDKKEGEVTSEKTSEDGTDPNNNTSCCSQLTTWKGLIVGLIVVIIHVFYGIQVCFGSYLLTFAVKSDLMLTKSTGALMTTLYWTCYTFFKFPIMMLLSGHDNGRILLVSFTGVLASSVLLLYGHKNEKILWIGIVLLGSSMSPIWACVFGYMQQWFPVSGFIGSLLVVSSMMAEFAFPAIISSFIAIYPAILMWITFACSSVMITLFLIVMILCNTKFTKAQEF